MVRMTQQEVDSHLAKPWFSGNQKKEYSHKADEGPESALQRKAEQWLNAKGYPYIHDRSRGKNKPGSILDLHIYLPRGRHVVIEFKDKKGGMSDEQLITFKTLLLFEYEVYEVRSFKRFLEIMNEKEQTTPTSPEI